MPTSEEPAAAEPQTRDWRSLNGVLIVQSQNVLNDKITQFILIGLAGVLAAGMAPGTWTFSVLDNYDLFMAIPMSLPFVLFAPLSGWLSDHYSKRTVILWCLILQIAVLAWIAVGIHFQAIWFTMSGFFLLALQSTILSPAKMGICKELVGSEKLAVAAGWMQMLSIICIILGTVVGGRAFSDIAKATGDPWQSALIIVAVLLLFSFVPFLVMMMVKKTPAQGAGAFKARLMVEHFRHLKDLLGHRELRLAGFGDMFFWFAGGALTLILIDAGKELYPNGETDAIEVSGYFNGCVGGGIALGSVLVSIICRKGNQLGLIPIGAFGMTVTMGFVYFQTPNTWPYYLNLVALGASSAGYLVPLNALIQDLPAPDKRGRVLSAINLLNSLAALAAIPFVLILRVAGFETKIHFVVLACLALCATIFIMQLMPRHFLRFISLGLTNMIYRVTALHPDRIPQDRGVLMISNHVSYIDAFIISAASPRPVRFVILSSYMKVRPIAWFLRLFHVIPISQKRAKDAIRITAEAVEAGHVVCIFPEGQLTRTGMLNELQRGFELIARKAKSPVLPVYMDALWGSIFSFDRLKYFYKVPRRFPYPVTVNFGEPIPHDEVTIDGARAAIQDLSAEAFAKRVDLDRTLGGELVRALKRRPSSPAFIEVGKRRRVMKRGVVLANAAGLAKIWRRNWAENRQRVGILLPPGSMPALFNVAVVLSGRTPVNLPLELATLDDGARQQLLDEHGIDCVMTSVHLFQNRELPDGHFDMTAEILQIGPAARIFGRLAARFETSWSAARRMNVRHGDPHSEAFAYLAKSTTGGYSLVSLSHRNVLASVYQIESTLLFQPGDEIFVESGFDEIAAAMLGLWRPLLKRGAAVYRGLSARQTPVSVTLEEEEPELVLLTSAMVEELIGSGQAPTEEVRGFLDFSTTGLSATDVDRLEEGGADYCRWAAPNELGAFITMSTTDPNSMIPGHGPQTGKKPGSIGRLMPGVSGRIVNSTDEFIGLHEHGRLFVQGGAFSEAADSVDIDGVRWIESGLRGHFDQDGFFIATS